MTSICLVSHSLTTLMLNVLLTPQFWSSEDYLQFKTIPLNSGNKTATTFCLVNCDVIQLRPRTQSTLGPLTLFKPGLDCCIQGVAICVPCYVEASLLPVLLTHSLSSLSVFRGSGVIRGGLVGLNPFFKPLGDRVDGSLKHTCINEKKNICVPKQW